MEEVQLAALKKREGSECLDRWGLGALRVGKFRYDFSGDVESRDAAKFVTGLLGTAGVRSWLNGSAAPDAAVGAERLQTRAVSMALFDPVVDCGDIVTPAGSIRQCREVALGGVPADDELRKWLLALAGHAPPEDDVEDLEAATVPLAEKAQDELLFRLFSLLAIGGKMCQADYALQPYLDLTKALYRDVATVYRRSADKEVAIATKAFALTGPAVFGADDARCVCLLMVEPKKRTATMIHSDGAKGAW